MGASDSKMHGPETAEDVLQFSESERRRLFKRFIRLDKDQSGGLDVAEFLSLERIRDNPLAQRLVHVLDRDRSGYVDFDEFLDGLNRFSKTGHPDEKLHFMFDIYDINGDGFISNGDLFEALRLMAGDSLTRIQLQQVVDKTLREADKDGDGKLCFQEFRSFLLAKNSDFIEQVSIGKAL